MTRLLIEVLAAATLNDVDFAQELGDKQTDQKETQIAKRLQRRCTNLAPKRCPLIWVPKGQVSKLSI